MNLVPFLIAIVSVFYICLGHICNDQFLVQLKDLDDHISNTIASMEHIIEEQNKTIQEQKAIIYAQVRYIKHILVYLKYISGKLCNILN